MYRGVGASPLTYPMSRASASSSSQKKVQYSGTLALFSHQNGAYSSHLKPKQGARAKGGKHGGCNPRIFKISPLCMKAYFQFTQLQLNYDIASLPVCFSRLLSFFLAGKSIPTSGPSPRRCSFSRLPRTTVSARSLSAGPRRCLSDPSELLYFIARVNKEVSDSLTFPWLLHTEDADTAETLSRLGVP